MKITLLSTYAPSEEFGGPARTHHQRLALENAGHDVSYIVVDSGGSRGSLRRSDLRFSIPRRDLGEFDPMYSDVDLGNAAAADGRLIAEARTHLADFGTQFLMLEQPYLVGVAEQLTAASNVEVIYSCHNIEWVLRRELERFDADRRRADRHLEVLALEHRAVDLASAVTALCATDVAKLREEFGVDAVLVPNGTSVAQMPLPTDGLFKQRAQRTGHRYFAFAGSSYWPNTDGFGQIATPSLGFLPPTTRIEVAGSVCAQLHHTPAVTRQHATNFARLSLNGFLPMASLVEMMRHSTAVLVPIFLGQGSNLKTADALASGAPVIMTEKSTHGYEDLLELDREGVWVATTPEEFRAAMSAALDAPQASAPLGLARRARLTWSSRLQPLVELIDSLGQR